MFSSLMAQRREFLQLLAAHSDRVVASTNATLRLVNGLGPGDEDIAALVAEVNGNEKSADEIKASQITLLHQSFTTPINRVAAIADRAAVAMREAVAQLFATEGDKAGAWHAMKMHGFHFMQQAVLDSGKRAARTLEEILLENA